MQLCKLCVHIETSSLWAEFVNKNRSISVRLVSEEVKTKRIEYIERNLLEKSVKRPFCCTVSILQMYLTYYAI